MAMFFGKRKEREIKMIWRVRKGQKESFLVGTAHFFPYSFRKSLAHYLKDSRVVLFEGPLDKENMEKVVQAGTGAGDPDHLLNALDRQIVDAIGQALGAPSISRRPYLLFKESVWSTESWVFDLVRGMKPWLAFFTIWVRYLERKGWIYSVDLDGYAMAGEMGKKIVALETIEEQISVLESLSLEKILNFLKNVDHWDGYVRDYVKRYLAGDSLNLRSMSSAFPSRTFAVINSRDDILFRRMLPYLEEGDAVAFVGAPHIRGISRMLETRDYRVESPANV
jgi:uncharacterized protein YbaP (TraB family)